MTRYLATVETVHDAAAVCDYLVDHADAGDAVVVVSRGGDEDRDTTDATNVFRARLPGVSVERARGAASSGVDLSSHAREHDVDVIVVRGDDAAGTGGPDLNRVHAEVDRPVVVLPDG